jgi:ABC-type uncharacterized transport system ATPase subunit
MFIDFGQEVIIRQPQDSNKAGLLVVHHDFQCFPNFRYNNPENN